MKLAGCLFWNAFSSKNHQQSIKCTRFIQRNILGLLQNNVTYFYKNSSAVNIVTLKINASVLHTTSFSIGG